MQDVYRILSEPHDGIEVEHERIMAHDVARKDLIENVFKCHEVRDLRRYAELYSCSRWQHLDGYNPMRIEALFIDGIDVFNYEGSGFCALVLNHESLLLTPHMSAELLIGSLSELVSGASYCSVETSCLPRTPGPVGFCDLLYHVNFVSGRATAWHGVISWIFVYDPALFYAYTHFRNCGYFGTTPAPGENILITAQTQWRVDMDNQYIILPGGYLCPREINDDALMRIARYWVVCWSRCKYRAKQYPGWDIVHQVKVKD